MPGTRNAAWPFPFCAPTGQPSLRFSAKDSQFAYYAFQVQRGVDLGIARGMQLSVFCGENIPFINEAEIEPATAGTFYGAFRARTFQHVCKEWPHDDVPAKVREPIASDVPVLMLSGELDPVTPPGLATPLLRWLPNGRQIIMRNATHTTYECTEKLALDFIERGSTKDLDASCVDGIKRLPFLTTLSALSPPK